MRFPSVTSSRPDAGDVFNVPTYRASHAQVVVELRRARRYEHPLGVAMVSLQPPARPASGLLTAGAASQFPEVTPAVYGLLGGYLRNTLRETDILTGVPESLAYALFLPGVDRHGAELALERLREGFLECAGFDLRVGVAAFPDDGLTIEDLFGRACDGWRAGRRPEIELTTEPRYSHG